jgi:TetR/AcrR family transcriptional regulator, transcriptional repressor for nem operon
MRYRKNHKQEIRERILKSGSKQMRVLGSSLSIHEVMQSVGLTHGAFYNHFRSRSHFVMEAFEVAMDTTISSLLSEAEDQSDGFSAVVSKYLSRAHRDEPETACALAIFAEEMRLGGKTTRSCFATKLEKMVNAFAEILENAPAADRRSRALAAASILAGGIMLARACRGTKISDEILDASQNFARQIPHLD